MVKFCTTCGTANTPDAGFCNKCGAALTAVDNSISQPSVSGERPIMPEAQPIGEPKPIARWKLAAASTATLLIIAMLYFWLFLADDMRPAASGSVAKPDNAASEYAAELQLFAVTEVNVRDQPTTKGSAIIGKLPRGSAVTGTLKMGKDGTGGWFELTDGNGYIADVNLSEIKPPEIIKMLDSKSWTADTALDIWSQPDVASALLDRVSPGTTLTFSGLTANDFIEVEMPKGGVGYLADGAAILSRQGGKPISIAFNPQTCSFGGDLGVEFGKLGARLKAQWQTLEDKEFIDDEAREKAYSAVEGKSSYVKLQRSFEGLALTALAQHYESQSIYFADPPARVIEIFRRKGFRIGNDGTFPSTELYAGITATRGEGAAYGRTELSCGV
jgi:hypothetical protein